MLRPMSPLALAVVDAVFGLALHHDGRGRRVKLEHFERAHVHARLSGPREDDPVGALDLEVVSLDAELVRRAGKGVPEIVAERGWPGFRDLEEEVVRDHARQDGRVIDCGGGVVEREANFAQLRAAGPVVWLRAAPATIVRRIQGDTERPSLTGAKSFTDEVVEVLARREPLYRRLAHAAQCLRVPCTALDVGSHCEIVTRPREARRTRR